MGIGCSCLDDDEYVLLDYPTGKIVRSGPGCKPYFCAKSRKNRKITLDETQYIIVKHLNPLQDDVLEIISGPALYCPRSGYSQILGQIREKLKLTIDDYVLITDEKTGIKKIVEGPILYTPISPYEKSSQITKKPKLTDVQYIIVTDELTGTKKTIVGPCVFVPGPHELCSNVIDMVVLNNTQYAYVSHQDTAIIDIVEGPRTFALAPLDKVCKIMDKIVLKKNQYIKISDDNTGIVRVERGASTIILRPYEKPVGTIKQAHEINDGSAIIMFDQETGDYKLIKMEDTPYIFFPSETQDVVEVREKIRLEKHEVMIIVDKNGHYSFMRGCDDTRSFFLPPYCHIFKQEWSINVESDTTKDKTITRFDMRPQYMDFKFPIRTRDNVEIILNLNFYWQIVDIEKMVATTSDVSEDICKHAMSQILSETSRKNMKEFMETFNEVVQRAVAKDDTFYAERGIVIHNVEIIGRKCQDTAIEQTFQEIIKAKANRIRGVENQDGENEIKLCKLEGEIRAEELQGQLLEVKKKYIREASKADGECDADKITKFIENLPSGLTMAQRLSIFFDIKNTERVSAVAKSGTTLYITPKELDISVTNVNYSQPTPDQIQQIGNKFLPK